jgi:hypothetical protein
MSEEAPGMICTPKMGQVKKSPTNASDTHSGAFLLFPVKLNGSIDSIKLPRMT